MQLFNTLFTLELTAERHFCSIFKHESFAALWRRHLANGSRRYVFSADGALLTLAWSNVPALEVAYGTSAESATQRSMNRAFSADGLH